MRHVPDCFIPQVDVIRGLLLFIPRHSHSSADSYPRERRSFQIGPRSHLSASLAFDEQSNKRNLSFKGPIHACIPGNSIPLAYTKSTHKFFPLSRGCVPPFHHNTSQKTTTTPTISACSNITTLHQSLPSIRGALVWQEDPLASVRTSLLSIVDRQVI